MQNGRTVARDPAAAINGCIGPNSCQGSVIPISAMALAAVKVAALTANGDDWGDAIRTQPDEYRVYKQAEDRRSRDRKVRVGWGLK